MLTRADEKTSAALKLLLDKIPENSVRLSALLGAYGTDRGFFNVWIQNDFAAVISRLENTFSVIDFGGLDLDEAAFFLDFNPYFRRLTGNVGTVRQISLPLSARFTLERVNLMRFAVRRDKAVNLPPAAPAQQLILARQPELRAVYDLIAGVLPQESDYAAWYADLNHRMRHGCARAYLLFCGGKPACACLVSAESIAAGLISGVATKSELRGRGFATHVIACVCADLADSGKISVLECMDNLLPFYENLGFEKIGGVAELEVELK